MIRQTPKTPVVSRSQHYKLYKSGKYLVTSAIMGLSILSVFTVDKPTKAHADTVNKVAEENVSENGNAVTTTSATQSPATTNSTSDNTATEETQQPVGDVAQLSVNDANSINNTQYSTSATQQEAVATQANAN